MFSEIKVLSIGEVFGCLAGLPEERRASMRVLALTQDAQVEQRLKSLAVDHLIAYCADTWQESSRGAFYEDVEVALYARGVAEAEEPLCLYVACDYGLSRSAGCAAAIISFFCAETEADYLWEERCPNPLVYAKVLGALRGERLSKVEWERAFARASLSEKRFVEKRIGRKE